MRTLLAAAVLAIAGLAPAVAVAQPLDDDRVRADAEFSAGKKLLAQGKTADACSRFAESQRLAPGLGVTLYLADCYQRLGKTASAWAEFRSAEALARARKDKRAGVAHLRAQALEPSLARITLRVAPRWNQAPLEISCDGHPEPIENWSQGLPVDPGDHVVLARSGGLHRTYNLYVDKEKPSAEVDVDELEGEPPPAPPPPPESSTAEGAAQVSPADASPPPETTASNGDSARLWATIGFAAVGVAGVGIGSVFGLKAISNRNASNDGPCNAQDLCTPSGLSLRRDAIDDARISTVAFVVGGVGLAASAAIVLFIPRSHDASVTQTRGLSRAWAISASPVPGGAGALVRTTF